MEDWIRDDELMHYGRLGMKWGQHIFGKDKTSSGKKTAKKKLTKEQKKRLEAMRKGKEKAAKERARKAEILKSPTKLMKHRSEFTQEEIDQAMKTFKWEAELSRLSQQEIDRGRQYLNTISAYMETGIRVYNAGAKIYNATTSGKEGSKSLPIVGQEKKDDKNKKK